MDIGSIFLTLAVLILVGLFVSAPFIQKQPKLIPEDHDLSSLLAEHERVLNALQELDFDHALGKVPAEDYPIMRLELMQKGVTVLRKLDEIRNTKSDMDGESQLEAAIRERRTETYDSKTVVEGGDDEDLEALIAKRRSARKVKSAGFCAKCGNPLLVSDTFCPNCGNSLK
jgi:hypothetical protein